MDEQEIMGQALQDERPAGEAFSLEAELRARREADIREFLEEYPEVRPEEIPEEVWEEVRRGVRLAEAYRRWQTRQIRAENRALRDKLAAGATNRWNQRRSLGSQRSSGRGAGRDAFLEALMDERN